MSKLLSIGGYYGGKVQSVKKILPYLPTCSTLVSPFCGFASVELNSGADHLVLNDASIATFCALMSIRDDVQGLIDWLGEQSWDKDCYWAAERYMHYGNINDRGRRAIAYSAMAHHRGGSKSGYSPKQAGRAAGRNWSYLESVSQRLQRQTIASHDFRKCFDPADNLSSGITYYLDPPYLNGGEHYQVTMSVDDHADMLDLAIATPCPVAISGYASELYDERLKDWQRVKFSARNNHRQNKTEVLWVKS